MQTAIVQHVIPRRRAQQRTYRTYRWQRGSINSTTITVALGAVLICAVTVLSFVYLGQVQNTAAQEGDIHQLEERIIELREQQRSLELEGAELRSIRAIEGRIPDLNLITANQVSYLAQPGDRVAARGSE